MSAPIITVENLSKRYIIGHQRSKGDGLRHAITNTLRAPIEWLRSNRERKRHETEEYWALKDVSFDVKQGEVLGIIGRNGAGKSTLLKILSRITEPTSGRIRIDGRVASLLEVGTGFHPELTGRENIFLNGAILGMSRIEIKRKFDEIVAFSEVEKFLDTPVKRYSSGMYVRLAFAVAAHLEPEILIVDEVLAVGDGQFQNKCMGKMEDVTASGRTILFVSHNMGAIRRLCSHGVLLNAGSVVRSGTINHVLSAYNESLPKASDNMRDKLGRSVVTVRDIGLYVNNTKRDAFATGETVEIRITLSFDHSITDPIRVGISLENMSGLFTLINYSHFQAITFSAKDSVISAVIKNIPLAEGLYRLHLRILSRENEIYWNTSVKDVRIDAGDYFGTGIRGEESHCPWLHRIEWNQIET